MASRQTWGLVIALGLLLASGHTASAQDRSLELAKQHFDEGQSLFVAGKFTEAAAEFQQAYDAKPLPAFLFNIAVCHEKNQDFVKALAFYERYLEKDPHSTDRDRVQKRVAAIRLHLNPPSTRPVASRPASPVSLPPVRPKGMVVIESRPEGAAIYLGDKRRGIFTRTPYTGTLPTGKQTVILELRKFKPERKTFYVRGDRLVYLYFALSAEEYLGWIEVKANVPGADVFFDQKKVGAVGRTPYTGFLRPGRRAVFVEKPGYQPVRGEVQVTAGKDHVVNVELQKVPFGWLRVTGHTVKEARILVDKKPICQGTPCQTELAPGEYSVEVQRKGWKSYRERVTVRQAAETQLAVRLMPRPPRTKAYVSFGVAGALLVSGIVCGALSAGRASDLEASGSTVGRPYDSEDPRLGSGKVLAITADALFGVGAITAGLGLYYLLRNEGPDSYGEARERPVAEGETAGSLVVSPTLIPGGAGLAGALRF